MVSAFFNECGRRGQAGAGGVWKDYVGVTLQDLRHRIDLATVLAILNLVQSSEILRARTSVAYVPTCLLMQLPCVL